MRTGSRGLPVAAVVFFAANALFGSGLFFHAFLYNFYLDRLGFAPTVMGQAAAALTAGGLAGLLPAGWVVDRLGSRRGLIVGACVCAVGLAVGALAASPVPVYLAAALAGAGNAFWRVTQAPMLMRIAPPEQRSRIFSLNVALIIGAGAAGVAIAGAVPGWMERIFGVDPLTALRLGLGLGAACTALSAGLYLAIPLPAAAPAVEAAPATAAPAAPGASASRAQVAAAIVLIGLWMVGPALVAPFFNLFFYRRFALSVERVGLIFGIANGAWALAVLASGEAATRWGLSRFLTAWLFLLGPSLLLLPLAGPGPALALFFLQGMAQPAANPLIDQILMERSAVPRRGAVSAWRNVAADLSAIAGASAGGWILAAGSFPALFVAAGVVALAVAVPLSATLRGLHRA